MPLTEEHKRQRSKNLALLAILLSLAVILFGVTMIRLGG